MSSLRFTSLRRILEDGTVWDINFESGLNLLVGEHNTSKTTTLRIIDYCLGDETNARRKFGSSITDEYSRFELKLSVDEVPHTLIRRLKQQGQLILVDVNGELMNSAGFNAWIMDSFGWPMIHIPRGLDPGVTDENPLTFRALYRHIYRRAESWTEFASREFDYYRQAVIAFFLGVAEEVYEIRGVGVRIRRLESELSQLESRRRELRSMIDDFITRATQGEWGDVRPGLSSIHEMIGLVDQQIRDAQHSRGRLAAQVRANPGYDSEQDAHLTALNAEISQVSAELSELVRIVDEQKRLVETLQGDRLRIQRAAASTKVLSSILVTACPACYQPIAPPDDARTSEGGHCYVCGQETSGDVRQRRLELEEQAVEQESAELEDVIQGLEIRLPALQVRRDELQRDREQLLQRLESERKSFVTPLLREFEGVQFRLGQLAQRKEVLQRLSELQVRVVQLDQKRQQLTFELQQLHGEAIAQPSARGLLIERTNLLAEAMNKFIARVPVSGGLGGLISIDPQGFIFYVGSETWDNALGDELRVLFFLAYHYAYLELASNDLIPHPGIAVLDNPFQQDVPSNLVEVALLRFHELCETDPTLQVIVTTRRNLPGLSANRVMFEQVFNPDPDDIVVA